MKWRLLIPSLRSFNPSDSLITAKIKGEMAITKDINSGRIKVVTEDGDCVFNGIGQTQRRSHCRRYCPLYERREKSRETL